MQRYSSYLLILTLTNLIASFRYLSKATIYPSRASTSGEVINSSTKASGPAIRFCAVSYAHPRLFRRRDDLPSDMPAWLVWGWRGWAAITIVERGKLPVHQSDADRHVSSFNVGLRGSTLLRVLAGIAYQIIWVDVVNVGGIILHGNMSIEFSKKTIMFYTISRSLNVHQWG